MKRFIFFILLIGFWGNISAQDLPKYYFNIKGVLSSPYAINNDSTDSYSAFRALSVSEEGHYFLVIEQISLKGIEGREKAMIGQYYLLSKDFSLYKIYEIELMKWESEFKFLIRLNEEDVFEIDISEYSSDKIKVKKTK